MQQEVVKLQKFINKEFANRGAVKALEAGSGFKRHVNLGQQVYWVGIDISEGQLERDTMLNEKILGDLQTYHFPPSSFDAIICWDVLEHLSEPELALQEFASAIKPNGIVIIKSPNVLSVKGLLTKFLPYSLHVWAYKIVFGKADAEKEEAGPFRTFLRFSMAPKKIKRFFGTKGLTQVYFDTYDASSRGWLQKNKVVHTLYRLVTGIIKVLSLGYLGDSDFVIVLQKV